MPLIADWDELDTNEFIVRMFVELGLCTGEEVDPQHLSSEYCDRMLAKYKAQIHERAAEAARESARIEKLIAESKASRAGHAARMAASIAEGEKLIAASEKLIAESKASRAGHAARMAASIAEGEKLIAASEKLIAERKSSRAGCGARMAASDDGLVVHNAMMGEYNVAQKHSTEVVIPHTLSKIPTIAGTQITEMSNEAKALDLSHVAVPQLIADNKRQELNAKTTLGIVQKILSKLESSNTSSTGIRKMREMCKLYEGKVNLYAYRDIAVKRLSYGNSIKQRAQNFVSSFSCGFFKCGRNKWVDKLYMALRDIDPDVIKEKDIERLKVISSNIYKISL